jgi:nucleotide-binding universal stress UspA family protein
MTNQNGTVLCGVDGSEQSVHAARAAHALANGLQTRLLLAHVSSGGGLSRLPRLPDEGEVEDDLEVIADSAARAGLTGVRIRRVEARSTTAGLIAAARVESPQLIVVGASGSSGVRAALLGSVAGELPLKAPCPVVITPSEALLPDLTAPAATGRSIVGGISESPEAPAVAAVAGQLARALDLRLVLVHARLPTPPAGGVALSRHSIAVADDVLLEREQRRTTELVERAIEWSGCPPERVEAAVEVGAPAERIEALAEQAAAELIVVGSRGRGRLSAAVLGSTSRALASGAARPVVIVGPGARGCKPPLRNPPAVGAI